MRTAVFWCLGIVAAAAVQVQAADTTPPTVQTTAPANGAAGANLLSPITVTFSEPMDRASVETFFSITPAAAGGFSWSGNTLTFDSKGPLAENTSYTVRIGAAARDAAANAMPAAYAFTFRTGDLLHGGQPLPPGYLRNLLHLGSRGTDRYTSSPSGMPSHIWDYFILAGFAPEHAHQPFAGQAFDLKVDATENPMVWTAYADEDGDGFLAEDIGDRHVMHWAIYVIAPTARDARLGFSCDDALKVWMDGGATPILGQESPAAGTSSVFRLEAGAHAFVIKNFNLDGGGHAALRFVKPDGTEMGDLRYSLKDPVRPKVAFINPANGASGAPLWTDVFIQFTEPMDTARPAGEAASISGGVPGTWAWTDSRTLVFTPSGWLAPDTTYTVNLLREKTRDLAGNRLLGTKTFTFTTSTAALPPPSLTGILPADAGTNRALAGVKALGSNFLRAGIRHPPGAFPFGGHYYRLTEKRNWFDARTVSEAEAGHLATLSSAEEDRLVWGLGGFNNCWIGLTDEVQEGVYRWVTGEPFSYSNWSPGEPSDWGAEDFGHFWWGLKWNDVGSEPAGSPHGRPYVCEFERERIPDVRLRRAGFSDVVATNVRFDNAGQLTFDLAFTGAVVPGEWDVVVTNPDGQSGVLRGFVSELDTVSPGPVTGLSAEADRVEINLAWTNPVAADLAGTAIFRREGAAPTFAPAAGGIYQVGQTYGDAVCVYSGAGTSFTDAGLRAATTHHYAAFAFDTFRNFSDASTRASATTTASAFPPGPVTEFSAEANHVEIDLAWTNPAANFEGVAIFRRAGAAPTFAPAAGGIYQVGQTYGDAVCVYSGAGTSFTDAGLPTSTTERYAAFAFDSSRTYSTEARASATTASGPAPYVQSTQPGNGATGVPVGTTIRVDFSTRMNTATTELAFSIAPAAPGRFSWLSYIRDPNIIPIPNITVFEDAWRNQRDQTFSQDRDLQSYSALVFTPDRPLDGETLYTVRLSTIATDSVGSPLVSPYSFSFTTAPVPVIPNQPPFVDAGPGRTVTQPEAASLDGTVADDGKPSPPGAVTTLWTKVSGPGSVAFGNASVVDTTASFSAPGTYVLRLSASDGELSASDETTVVVNPPPAIPNAAPVVNAGPDRTVTLPAPVFLDGTVTDDGKPSPPGVVTALWTKVSGPGTAAFGNASAVDTPVEFSAPGTYVLRLAAGDGALSAADEVTVAVEPQPNLIVERFFAAFLARAPTPDEDAFWRGQIASALEMGAPLLDAYISMGIFLVDSAAYRARNRTNAQFIGDLYRAFLGRDPSAADVTFWQSRLGPGVARSGLVLNFGRTGEFVAAVAALHLGLPANTAVDIFVSNFYRGLLHRIPDAGGFGAWSQALLDAKARGAAAVKSRAREIAQGFVSSAEFRAAVPENAAQDAAFVNRLYEGFLQRGAETGGIAAWKTKMASLRAAGRTEWQIRVQLIDAFTASSEFQALVQRVLDS